MSRACCRAGAPGAAPSPGRAPRAGGFLGAVGGVGSGALLVLMPKCPACAAAYVAAWTGVGLSLPAASGVRTALIVVCAASAALLALRWLRRVARRTAAPR